MTIKLSSLPLSIYNKIPLSIKTYRDEYELTDLPYDIQKLVNSYSPEKTLTYTDRVYDFEPIISPYGDFYTISNLRALIIKYMNNYLSVLTGEYPFNGDVGSSVKLLLQKKDTTIQNLYMTEELDNMIRSFGNNIDGNISVNNFNITKSSNGVSSTYNLNISLNINDETTNINTSVVL
jgi:hypothetical protein